MMTIKEIEREGYRALIDRLGRDGFIRFMRIFDKGHGDYTKERQEEVPETINDVLKEMGKSHLE